MNRLKLTILLLVVSMTACFRPSPEEQMKAKAREAVLTYFEVNIPKEAKLDSLVLLSIDTITEKDLGFKAHDHLYNRFLQKQEIVEQKKREYNFHYEGVAYRENALLKIQRNEINTEIDSIRMMHQSIKKIDSLIYAGRLDSVTVRSYLFTYKTRFVMPDMTVEEANVPFVLTPDLKIELNTLKKFFERMQLAPY